MGTICFDFPFFIASKVVIKNRLLVFLLSVIVVFALSNDVLAATAIHRGKASWYGHFFQGRPTANGELFLLNKFSAAHKSLPFGIVLRVHNLENDKQVLVRINDRGPYIGGRVIDLSKRAATQLQMLNTGVAQVLFSAITDTQGRLFKQENGFYVRVFSTNSPKEAHRMAYELRDTIAYTIQPLLAEKPYKKYALCVGPFSTFTAAEKVLESIDLDYEVKDIIEAPLSGNTIPFYRTLKK